MNKNGFTLVELSIVLVIIGLLVGGVLVGQSLIESAKIQSAVRQIGQFDIAVSLFKTNFKSLPGDSSIFTAPGDNNSIIEYSGSGCCRCCGDISNFASEISNFWVHLAASGLQKSGATFSSSAASGVKLDINVPKFKVGNNSGVIAYSGYISGTGAIGPIKHYYEIEDFSRTTDAAIYNKYQYSLKPTEALALDNKLDDGVATSGKVRAIGFAYGAVFPLNYINIASLQTGGCINDSDSTKYDLSSTNFVCGLRIEMLSQTIGQ